MPETFPLGRRKAHRTTRENVPTRNGNRGFLSAEKNKPILRHDGMSPVWDCQLLAPGLHSRHAAGTRGGSAAIAAAGRGEAATLEDPLIAGMVSETQTGGRAHVHRPVLSTFSRHSRIEMACAGAITA